jgi:tRNA pseudouridine13 synthase
MPRTLPDGEGTHWWLWVEKNGANTDWVAGQLAQLAGCQVREAGYAGLKDRHALTRQWFSVPVKADTDPDWENANIEGVRILEATRSRRKIQRGALEGNRFRIVVRDLEGSTEALDDTLRLVSEQGVPNYFGPQRFGFDGQNVTRAAVWLASPRRLSRQKRSLYLSAIRSFLFNQVLAERVRQNNWNELLPGELVILDGTRSFFENNAGDPDLQRRCQEFDVHPSGPLPGRADREPSAVALGLEQEVIANWPEWPVALAALGVKAARRPLRLVPRDLSWHISPGSLELNFSLQAGAFATSVLREIIQPGPDGANSPG